jgi:hypothetical protein
MTKKVSPDKITEKKMEMLAKLEYHYGNVRRAAKETGISAQTYYNWIKEDPAFGDQAELIRDIGYRNVKDNLLEMALGKAEKGDSAVLGKLLGIFCKNMPDELKMLNRHNRVPLRVGIRYVDTREEAQQIEQERLARKERMG